VSHLGPTELVRHACGAPLGARPMRHLAGCEECAAEVRSLREGRAALVGVTTSTGEARADCLDERAIAVLADASVTAAERDVLLAHLAVCPACRSAVSSVSRALSSPGVARELVAVAKGAGAAWVRWALPLGAAAALAALLLLQPPQAPEIPRHRQGPVVGGAVPVTIAPLGPTNAVRVLRWHGVRGADRYRVTLYDGAGAVLYETMSSDTVVALPADVEIEPGWSYYWIVAARTGFDRWETSAPAEFSTTGVER